MITQKTLQFLKDIKINNSKEWMDANRKDYEAAKKSFEDFVGEVLSGFIPFEPSFEDLQVKHCTFRINRDIRFSQNKAPYKSNFGAAFSRDGKKSPYADYYVQIEPGASFIAGGLWMPPADRLKGIRQEIDDDLADFKKIMNQKEFKKLFPALEGEQLKTAPQGYTADNEAIEYLRFKSFTVVTPLSDKEVCDKHFAKEAVSRFKVMKPFLDFLNRPVG